MELVASVLCDVFAQKKETYCKCALTTSSSRSRRNKEKEHLVFSTKVLRGGDWWAQHRHALQKHAKSVPCRLRQAAAHGKYVDTIQWIFCSKQKVGCCLCAAGMVGLRAWQRVRSQVWKLRRTPTVASKDSRTRGHSAANGTKQCSCERLPFSRTVELVILHQSLVAFARTLPLFLASFCLCFPRCTSGSGVPWMRRVSFCVLYFFCFPPGQVSFDLTTDFVGAVSKAGGCVTQWEPCAS